MNRLQIAKLHFQLFRKRTWWWWFWSLTWLFQSLSAAAYVLHGMPFRVADRGIAAILLLLVFHGGNFYSERNNSCLRTRPLPRGTCFLVDALFPALLFLMIPLLREIPPVIQSGYSLADLAWAWLDLLLLYLPLFSCAWLLGAFLPAIRTPPRLAGHLFGVFAGYWLLKQVLPVLGEITPWMGLYGSRIMNEQRYFTFFLATVGTGLLTWAAVRMRIENQRAVLCAHALLVPVFTVTLLMGPGWVESAFARLELRRSHPDATDARWEVLPVPQLGERTFFQNQNTPPGSFSQRFTLPVHAQHETGAKEAAFQLLRLRARVADTGPWLPMESAQSDLLPRGMESRALRRWYDGGILLLNSFPLSQISPWDFTRLQFNLTGDTLPNFQGGAVELSYDLHLVPYQMEELARDIPLDQSLAFRNGPENLRISRATLDWQGPRFRPPEVFQFSAWVSTRTQNLMWRNLLHGRPSPQVLFGVLKNKNTDKPVGVSTIQILHPRRNATTAFPLAEFRTSGRLQLSHTDTHPHEPHLHYFAPGTPPENFQIDWLVLRPQPPVRVQLQAYQRFYRPASLTSQSLFGDLNSTDRPPGTWEVERLHRLSVEPLAELDRDWRNRFVYGLGLRHGSEYRDALFEATKMHPRFSAIIVGNGWEEEAMDVWLDLARQGTRVPSAARLAFHRSGDPRLLEALEAQNRWAPLGEER